MGCAARGSYATTHSDDASKNYHIIASLEETLLIEIKQSILGKSHNDMDTLLDEE